MSTMTSTLSADPATARTRVEDGAGTASPHAAAPAAVLDIGTAITAAAAEVDTAGEPPLVLTAAAAAELRDLTRARWAGWLAPLDKRAGDLRPGVPLPTSGQLKTREMPLPFFWQKATTHGGQIVNGAVEIGAVTHAEIRPRPDRDDEPWIWGTGYIDLNDPDGLQFTRRLADRMSRWISVKLDFDPNFEPPKEVLSNRKDDEERHVSPTDHPDWWRLMNVTAESQPAFDGAEVSLLDDIDEIDRAEDEPDIDDDDLPEDGGSDDDDIGEDDPRRRRRPAVQLVSSGAEVNAMTSTVSTTMHLPPDAADVQPPAAPGPASGGSGPYGVVGGNAGDHGSGDALVAVVTGDTNLPIADRTHKWNGPEAANRLIEWAGGRFKLDVSKMAKVFLYRDSEMSPKMATAWKFPIADVIDNQVKIVPHAVFAAAAALRGARGGTKIPKEDQNAMKTKINTLYGRMQKQFNDPKIRSPFEAVVSDAHAQAMRTGDSAPHSAPPWRRSVDRRQERRGLPHLVASATSWAARVAEQVPEEPPREWFEDPGLTKPTKIRVTDDGRVFGHIAAWHSEHAGLPGVKPPRNRDKSYSKFHRHPVRCGDGTIVKTGPLASGGHSPADVSLAIETVQAHYDDPRYVLADVVCGEDEFGIWVSGALRPGVSSFQVMLADRYSFSGDWRYGELLAACSVSVPGFHLDADEEVGAVTAAAASAGVYDLPVVAEATPALIADASGVPAVLIAAGVVLDDNDEASDFTELIDALGTWLQSELAALRAEFGMTDTKAAPSTEQVIAQLQDMVTKELGDLRAEIGLPPVTGQDTPAEAPAQQDTPPAEAAAEQPPAGAPSAGTTESDAAQPADAPVGQEPAEAVTVSAAAAQVAQFQQWLSGQFASLRTEHAATQAPDAGAATTAATAAVTAAPAAQTADLSAERQALLAEVHGDEIAALFAMVHEEVA